MADDHEIIDLTAPTGRLSWSRVPTAIVHFSSEPEGRFRPLYWTGQALEAALWGRHPTLWYLDRLLLATVTLTCLYALLTRLAHPVVAAMVSLLPFAGPQVETWTRLGPNEAYAMPLTAAGLALVLSRGMRGRSLPGEAWVGYLLLALAGLAKENFVTLGPSLCLLMVALSWPRLRRRDWAVVGGVALVGIADVVAIELKVRRYGTLYPQDHDAASLSGFLGHVALYETISGLLPVVFAVVVVLYRRSEPRQLRPAVLVAAGVVMLVAPQAYLIAGTVLEGRYLYPIVLAVVVLWGYAGWLGAHSSHPRHVTALLAVLLVLPLGVGGVYGRGVAAHNVAITTQFQASLHQVETAADDAHARTIVIEPSDPYWDYEPTESYAAYLSADGYRVVTLPATVPPSEQGSAYVTSLAREIDGWSTYGSKDLQPLSALHHPCVSLVWSLPARRCTIDVHGFDNRRS